MLGMLETNRRHDHQAAQYLLHILENKGVRRQSFLDRTPCGGGAALGNAVNRSCGASALKQRRTSIDSQS
ncbi:unknown [Collinsella sp. CAG:289]|nr:unknown [Collinsella sp. CAG:289]